MKLLNILLVISLVMTPFSFAHASGHKRSDQQVNAKYQILSQDEMKHLVGGLSSGQLTIVTPGNNMDVSSRGWINYQVTYEVDGEVDFVLFVADNDGSRTELARRTGIRTGTGTFNGSFLSSRVRSINSVIVAELISQGTDPYDSCRTSTSTIYARVMRKIRGNGR